MSALDVVAPEKRAAAMEICERARTLGGRALLVGGAPRDLLVGRGVTDIDIEVAGIELDQFGRLLAGLSVDSVGTSFGVFKLPALGIDVSVPRTETRSGPGRRDFDVTVDPHMPFDVAARRRDFTINAMGFDPLDGVLLDPFDGEEDLKRRVLRPVDPTTFSEDALRVFRGMQLIARLGLTAVPELVELCRSLEPGDLSRERVFDEWRKMILLGSQIKAGLDFLVAVDWLRFFPELAATVGVCQDPTWHPEGDVFVHTGHCMDEFAARRVGDPQDDLIVGLAVLCHDFGKPATTEFRDGRWRAHGHEAAGVTLARTFLQRLTSEPIWIEVEPLVQAHLRPSQLHKAQAGQAAVRRLAQQVGRLDRLVRVAEADALGRPPISFDRFEAGDWLLEHAREENISSVGPTPILRGCHLIDELGMNPGPSFKPILGAAFEAQLDGAFIDLEGAIEWACRTAGSGPSASS